MTTTDLYSGFPERGQLQRRTILGNFGPLGTVPGDLLHTSYGMCSLFKCFYESVDGIEQGGLVRFPLKFDSGIMRGGSVPGMASSTPAVWSSGRAMGKRGSLSSRPIHRKARHHGPRSSRQGEQVVLTFTRPLDKATVSDLENYAVDRWNYDWAEHYGSPGFP